MPSREVMRNGRARREIDAAGLAAILRPRRAGAAAWIERVGAMPGQGVASMFSFGRAVGAVEGVVAALAIPVSYVAPPAWRRALQVPAGKDGSRLRASQLMPAYAAAWRRACDDGRAEAALIALYGMTQGGASPPACARLAA
jgi:crossover junction endodeoxyribonuclease RuvC